MTCIDCIWERIERLACSSPTSEEYRQLSLQALACINETLQVDTLDVEQVRSCREVTVAGAWGNIGDKIIHIRWFDTTTNPPTLLSEVFFNETTGLIVVGIDASNSVPCADSQEVISWTKDLCLLDSEIPTVVGAYSVNPTTGAIHIKDASGVDVLVLPAPAGGPANGFFGVAISNDIQTLYASHTNPDVFNILRRWDTSIDPFAPVLIGDILIFGIDITDSFIVALDVNPLDGKLYGLTYSNRGMPTPQDYKIYEIDPMTGGAILRTTIAGEYNGGATGFCFDPNGDLWTVTDEGATFKVSQWAFPSGAFINSPYALPSSDVAFIDITPDGTELYGQLGVPDQIDNFNHPAGTVIGTYAAAWQGLDLSLLPSAPAPTTTKFRRVFMKDLATDTVTIQNHDCITGQDLGNIDPSLVTDCPGENAVVDVGNIVENIQRNDQQYTLWKDDNAGVITYYWRVTRIDPLSSAIVPVENYRKDFTAVYIPTGVQSAAIETKAIREALIGPVTYTMNGCVKALSVRVRNLVDQNNPIRISDADANISTLLEGEEEAWEVNPNGGEMPTLVQPLTITLPTAGDEVIITRTEIV